MTETRTSRIKNKINQHKPAIIAVFTTVAMGVVALAYLSGQAAKSVAQLTEPDRLADPNFIVLENVQSNLWRDLDEPDNHYWLNRA